MKSTRYKIAISIIIVAVVLSTYTFSRSYFATDTKAAAVESFSFAAVGDFGNDTVAGSNLNKVLQGIGKEKPDFSIGLGDFVYSNDMSQVAPWCANVKNQISTGAATPGFGDTFPFELVSGNHDSGESNADIMTGSNSLRDCLPHRISNITEGQQINGSAYGLEYYFDYPSNENPLARIILLSPDLYGWDYVQGSSHYTFAQNAILSARDSNRPNGAIPWIIVGKHKNCITNGAKTCEYGTDLFNLLAGKNLGPNGSGYGKPVDLILEGHEHSYHRSKQLAVNEFTCTSFTVNSYITGCVKSNNSGSFYSKGGGVLAIVGTGGASLRSLTTSSDPETPYFQSWMGANESVPAGGANSWGFTKVTITRTMLKSEFKATTGNYKDSFTITTKAQPETSKVVNKQGRLTLQTIKNVIVQTLRARRR